ncbi:S8 family peptidase [Nocardioides caldifontis]|uniref:S8 family peptidase n=1 Tax=Nocardioides caldifontis TaxID=2588938 RepID=UPI0011DF9B44|nr:S8 family peptidase [Nocardioides caldifontis]
MRIATPARWALALSTLAASCALTATATTASAAPSKDPGPDLAPLVGTERDTAIEGRYIVVMEPDASAGDAATVEDAAVAEGGEVDQSFDTALTGFTAELTDDAVETLREDPDVAFIEADQRVEAWDVQRRAPWGLDRVDQRGNKLNGKYRFTGNGKGVTAYVIDTGIRSSHRELRGRVSKGFSVIKDGRGTRDCNGHGTHVAGTLGGKTYGVAKKVTLRPVRVLRCSGAGSNSGVIAGIDWVTRHHKGGPAVANLSLGSGESRAMDAAVQRAVADGVSFVVAAGNEREDACYFSPGRTPSAITVGSTRSNDGRSGFSNWGTCVDIFAPGNNITSSWYRNDKDTQTISGTSMASPHVAGAAAIYLQKHRRAKPEQVKAVLLDGATKGKVKGRKAGSPNRLLFTRVKAAPPNNILRNPGFEAGATGWSASAGVITKDTGESSYTGAWKAWLGGTGKAHTDNLSQQVAVPAGVRARLSVYLRINTNDDITRTKDTVSVQVVRGGTTTTLATYSNRASGLGYVRRTYDLSAWAGRTVTVRFRATEDQGDLTNFVIDNVGLSTR